MNYAIYQIKDPDRCTYAFRSLQALNEDEFSIDDYSCVYTNSIDTRGCTTDFDVLEKIFYMFNMKPLDDFEGRLLTTSDLVALEYNNSVRFYYCNAFRWQLMTELVKLCADD